MMKHGFYFDYDFIEGKQKGILTLAGITPLFLRIATGDQAKQVAAVIKEKFFMSGGVVTTLKHYRSAMGCSQRMGARCSG